MGNVRTTLLRAAAVVVLATLGCSDPERRAPNAIVGPVATSTQADVPEIEKIVTAEAKVAPHLMEQLADARVVGGTIVKNGETIGIITKAGDSTGNPGGGNAGAEKAAPDPIAPPSGPQLETWCMVRIWYDLDTGEIVSAEIQYCRDDGNGSGGGSNPPPPTEPTTEISFEMTCDNYVIRGRYAGCDVIMTSGENVSIDDFDISRTSDKGASKSGLGLDRWGGSTTSTAAITVVVRESDGNRDEVFSETKSVTVEARSEWGSGHIAATPNWYPPSHFSTGVLGHYHLSNFIPSIPNPVQGNGPWTGEYRMPERAPEASGDLHMSTDYNSSGLSYNMNGSICSAALGFRSASYYTLNDTCGTDGIWSAFMHKIIAHEREHEDGYNDCIDGATGQTAMRAMEAVTGSYSTVHSTVDQRWRDFYQNDLWWAGGYANAFNSGSAYYWRSGASWVLAVDYVGGDGGSGGC